MRLPSVNFPSVVLAWVIMGVFPGGVAAQTQTETKIRLMSDALSARDHGDLAAAKVKLEALQAIAPNDPNVRRMLAEVTARLEAPPAPPSVPVPPAAVAAAPVTPAPTPLPPAPEVPMTVPSAPAEVPAAADRVLMPAVHEEKPDVAAGGPEAPPRSKTSPEVMAAEAAAEALLHAGDNHLGTLVAYVQAQRALARAQAQEKNYAAAIATLDAALEELQKPSDELREERGEYVRKSREAAAADDGLKMHPHR